QLHHLTRQVVTGPDPNSPLEFEPDPVSVTQSQPEQQTGRIQGTVVSLIRIPGSHGPGVPETRETNVKCMTKLKANWMSVDIVISEGNIYRRQTISVTGYARWLKKI
ncbi:hypothetical protein Prudu_008089, partial [Prunus dulcis]